MHRSGHPRSGEQPVTEIRAEVVARLASTALADLPAVIAEHLPTPAEYRIAADTLADLARSELQESGQLPEQSVLNLSLNDLECLAAAWGVVGRWRGPNLPGTRTLGDAMKVLPTDVVADVVRVLMWGRLVDESGR